MKIARYSCHILMKLDFLGRFSNNLQIQIFRKFRPVEVDFVHVDKWKEILV